MRQTVLGEYYNAYAKGLHEVIEYYGDKFSGDADGIKVEKKIYEEVLGTIVGMARETGEDITPSFVYLHVVGMNYALLSHGYMAINNAISEITQDALDVQRENE